ncbi:hypothetical protein EIP91_008571 [Steccherinum ochraceum]|uniref:Uncharacterized protein n=1 Tax=Steccherinum ochraceum TaxID=92696 RepID=A0A4R0RG59_9APHY|nr:hypothetical protein EIP91_008571 [Steccherinum ochraceum]
MARELLSLLLVILLFGTTIGMNNNTDTIASCRTTDVVVRLPPFLCTREARGSSYKPLPTGWLYGNWKLTYSSQASYQSLENLELDSSPVFPQSAALLGQANDLSSYTLPNSTILQTGYGVDTPRRSRDKTLGPEWDDVYDFVGNGVLAITDTSFAFLAWGYDTIGVPYVVIYESPVTLTGIPSAIDIESRSQGGPSKATLDKIFQELRALNNPEITQLVYQIKPLVRNGNRANTGPVVCDAACVNNTVQASP